MILQGIGNSSQGAANCIMFVLLTRPIRTRLCATLCCCSKCRADPQHSAEAPRRPDQSTLGDEDSTGRVRTARWCCRFAWRTLMGRPNHAESCYGKCVLQAEPVGRRHGRARFQDDASLLYLNSCVMNICSMTTIYLEYCIMTFTFYYFYEQIIFFMLCHWAFRFCLCRLD